MKPVKTNIENAQDIRVVPEPGLVLVLVAGIALLAVVGRRCSV